MVVLLLLVLTFGTLSASQQYNDEESKKLFEYVCNATQSNKIMSHDTIGSFQQNGADINKNLH